VKKKLLVVFILAAALTTAPAFAGGRKKKASPPKPQTPLISSVTGNTITVTQDKATRAFMITPYSEIIVNGQKGTITDLKPGMTVNVTIGVDPTQAGRVVASGVPHGKKK
jgi:hypothetical protein